MINLLINAAPPAASEIATRFGGHPLVPSTIPFAWPTCRTCQGFMQFLAQLLVPGEAGVPDRLLLLFMCQNDPGACNEWEPDGGANLVQVHTLPQSFSAMSPPPDSGPTLRASVNGAIVDTTSAADYDSARDRWPSEHGKGPREVLGQLAGAPSWLQGDETPVCAACQDRMRFVAQLEEGPDHKTAMNFGGGCAYVFDCSCSAATGKLLWQC
jgi:hypothetical protein